MSLKVHRTPETQTDTQTVRGEAPDGGTLKGTDPRRLVPNENQASMRQARGGNQIYGLAS